MRADVGTTQVVTPGTEVQITASVVKIVSAVFKARHTNAGVMYLGLSNVSSTNGKTLQPGEAIRASFGGAAEKPAVLYVDAATANDRLDWHLVFEE